MSFGFLSANVLDGQVCKVRHFGLSFCRRGLLASRVPYYPNSDSRYQFTCITVRGDIELNPGPTSCSVCKKVIARNHRALSCDQCTLWCHMKCSRVKLREYKRLQQTGFAQDVFNRRTFCWCINFVGRRRILRRYTEHVKLVKHQGEFPSRSY